MLKEGFEDITRVDFQVSDASPPPTQRTCACTSGCEEQHRATLWVADAVPTGYMYGSLGSADEDHVFSSKARRNSVTSGRGIGSQADHRLSCPTTERSTNEEEVSL